MDIGIPIKITAIKQMDDSVVLITHNGEIIPIANCQMEVTGVNFGTDSFSEHSEDVMSHLSARDGKHHPIYNKTKIHETDYKELTIILKGTVKSRFKEKRIYPNGKISTKTHWEHVDE